MTRKPTLDEIRDGFDIKFEEKQILLAAAGYFRTEWRDNLKKNLKKMELLDENGAITDLGWFAVRQIIEKKNKNGKKSIQSRR
jgi:hypothetical protein